MRLGPSDEIVRKDDDRSKAVVWRNRLTFAYTGRRLARGAAGLIDVVDASP